jgi:hypothetical protein
VPRRLATILLLVYQAVFLNVFIPAHTRGQFTLDDRTPSPATAHLTRGGGGCCAPHSSSRPSDPTPTPADRANCAVCHLATHYTPPPVTDLRPEPLGFAHLLEPTVTQAPVTLHASLPYHGRAPPALA